MRYDYGIFYSGWGYKNKDRNVTWIINEEDGEIRNNSNLLVSVYRSSLQGNKWTIKHITFPQNANGDINVSRH